MDAQTSRAPDAPVTFTRDIAPILFTSCASCHRPQGSAPFSLLTFDDVRPRADRIVEIIGRPENATVEARARPRQLRR